MFDALMPPPHPMKECGNVVLAKRGWGTGKRAIRQKEVGKGH